MSRSLCLISASIVTAPVLGSHPSQARVTTPLHPAQRARLAGLHWTDETPSWSPNGRQIVFASTRGLHPWKQIDHLYLMNADGSGVRRLTRGHHDARDPSFSPDRKLIVYVAKSSEIDLIATDGGHRRLLTSGLRGVSNYGGGAVIPWHGEPILPTWSPNGRWIAFVNYNHSAFSSKDDQADLYVIRPDGTRLRRLAINIGGDALAWSPDSREIAVSGNDGQLYRIDARAKKPRLLKRFAYAEMTDIAWSPDGAKIAYVRGERASNSYGAPEVKNRRLWIMELKTHRLSQLRTLSGTTFPGPSDTVNITWLRRRRPLLAIDVTRRFDLLTADGRRNGTLPYPGRWGYLAPGSASPSGRKLLLLGGDANRTAIFVADVRSGRVRQLTQR